MCDSLLEPRIYLRSLDAGADFPLPLDSYNDQQSPSLVRKLAGRIEKEPLNLVATIIFFAAIAHTFLVAKFRQISYHYQQAYHAIEYLLNEPQNLPDPGRGHEKNFRVLRNRRARGGLLARASIVIKALVQIQAKSSRLTSFLSNSGSRNPPDGGRVPAAPR